jgi:hypothetical protein
LSEAADAAASLQPGRGHVDLFAIATLERVGGGLEYEQGLTKNLSAFAQGWLTKAHDDTGWRTDAGVVSGLRWRW